MNLFDADLTFDNSFSEKMKSFYSLVSGHVAPRPQIIKLNKPLCSVLGINDKAIQGLRGAKAFTGGMPPDGASSLAQVYAGHQFGTFNPQLGDGRALLLGEVIAKDGARVDIQLKGSGKTPYSRSGDGKAALGPVLREYLLSEAMHALGIPTTRGLVVATTGEKVTRAKVHPGAVLTRVASSNIRIGTFQYFAAQGQFEKVKQLADYTIWRHYPELANISAPYLGLLSAVVDRHASLVAQWMLVGFVHGVMNTDNMSISGETIDYGPCAFIDEYDPNAVFSSIDKGGRYAYNKQAIMAQWNLARFAETLLPIINENDEKAIGAATPLIMNFDEIYKGYWLNGMREKLGLTLNEDEDADLIHHLMSLMSDARVDYTLFFRELAKVLTNGDASIQALFDDPADYILWEKLWLKRLLMEPANNTAIKLKMDSVNPIYIPRNHKVEEVLLAAESQDDFEPFERLLSILEQPFNQQVHAGKEFSQPSPKGGKPYTTFCGT